MILNNTSPTHGINSEDECSPLEIIEFSESKKEIIQLRCERKFWEAQFKRTRQREEELQNKIAEIKKLFQQREEKLKDELEKSKSQIRYLRRQLYAKKTEKKGKKDSSSTNEKNKAETKKRGQQPGTCGHGRRDHSHLPVVLETVGIEESKCCCPKCGKPIIELASVDESEQIEIEVRGYRRKVRKKKYKKTCQCPGVPAIITAPGPNKLILKSKYGNSVWETLIIEKYLYQRPTNRTLDSLSTHGIHIPPGTVGDGLKRLAPLFSPVEQAIHEKSVSEKWWHADETRWMVFELFENKQNYKWYLWVFVSKSAVVNVIAPSRATTVVEDFFWGVKTGILCVDRYGVYKCFVKTREGFILAFCWAHVRRDFLDVGNSWPKLEKWALGWVNRIGMIFHLNNLRLEHKEKTKGFEEVNINLKKALAEMEKQCDKELTRKRLANVCRKTLESLKNHWEGLNVFVEHPHIPMDNSEAERKIRPGTVGRKNYYGSGAIWSAYFTAAMFSIFQTLLLWNINPRIWLSRYLYACAENGRKPPADISEFLPWKMTEKQKSVMDMNWQSPDTS